MRRNSDTHDLYVPVLSTAFGEFVPPPAVSTADRYRVDTWFVITDYSL